MVSRDFWNWILKFFFNRKLNSCMKLLFLSAFVFTIHVFNSFLNFVINEQLFENLKPINVHLIKRINFLTNKTLTDFAVSVVVKNFLQFRYPSSLNSLMSVMANWASNHHLSKFIGTYSSIKMRLAAQIWKGNKLSFFTCNPTAAKEKKMQTTQLR